MVTKPGSDNALTLSPEQVQTLVSVRTWWLEGERRLDYLAEHTQLRGVLEQCGIARDRFRAVTEPVAADVVPLLRLARTVAPNVAVNRDRETDAFARAFYRLLFDDAPLSERLTEFLSSVCGVGVVTASQLLFVAYPDRYPFVTPDVAAFLPWTPKQKRMANLVAQSRFGDGANGQVRTTLARFVWLDAYRTLLRLVDFADLYAVLKHAREIPKPVASRKKSATVRENGATYSTTSEATEADRLRYLEAFAASQNLTYPPLALRNYYLCHKTKPFVILAGLSGTGKTRLTELFAEVITGGDLRGRYRLLPVRPDWSDPSPLLGYHNALTGTYIGTPFLQTLRDAARSENRDRAYFVCLDEMNLARAEHYLADILSAMETRARELPLAGTFDAVHLPPNVFLSGTVNIEEGTHPFGAKVLDRANVIEFADVRFARTGQVSPTSLPDIMPGERERLFLSDRVETIADAERRLESVSPRFVEQFYETLSALSERLTERGFAFGYRVRDESLRYIAHSFAPDGSPLLVDGGTSADNFHAALDLQILQKVLPHPFFRCKQYPLFSKRIKNHLIAINSFDIELPFGKVDFYHR